MPDDAMRKELLLLTVWRARPPSAATHDLKARLLAGIVSRLQQGRGFTLSRRAGRCADPDREEPVTDQGPQSPMTLAVAANQAWSAASRSASG